MRHGVGCSTVHVPVRFICYTSLKKKDNSTRKKIFTELLIGSLSEDWWRSSTCAHESQLQLQPLTVPAKASRDLASSFKYLTIFNEVTFKSIFHKAFNLFKFDCENPLKSVPGTNQYYAIRVKFLAQRNNMAFDGYELTTSTL